MLGDASSWPLSVVHKRLAQQEATLEVVTRRTQNWLGFAANISKEVGKAPS
jgi:hypothetical protein